MPHPSQPNLLLHCNMKQIIQEILLTNQTVERREAVLLQCIQQKDRQRNGARVFALQTTVQRTHNVLTVRFISVRHLLQPTRTSGSRYHTT